MQPRGGDASSLRNQIDQLIERRHFTAGEDVGATGRGRRLATQPEALDQIVDVRQVIVNASGAKHDEPPPRHATEQLQQPPIARTVNAGRPRDHHFHPGGGRRFPRQPLAFDLRLLIDVAG